MSRKAEEDSELAPVDGDNAVERKTDRKDFFFFFGNSLILIPIKK
ncbi:MAG: hypothetical protein PHV07_00210 [Oscillospiraceae bacterium]|nr:hypothetical protein [Oscillospiraceae bacterium]